MKKIIYLVFAILISSPIMAKSFCYKVKFKDMSLRSFSFSTEIPTKDRSHASVTLEMGNKSFSDAFYCMKEGNHFLCDGDNDSGRYKIFDDYLELVFLKMGEPNKNPIEVRFKNPIKVKSKKVVCR